MSDEIQKYDEDAFTDEGLSDEQYKKANELAAQIQTSDQQTVTQFGTEAQAKLSDFSHSMLDHVQKKDTGPIGDILKELMQKLEQANPEELETQKQNVLKRLFKKMSSSVQEVLSKYQKLGAQIDKITVRLENQKKTLVSDIDMLEQLFQTSKDYFDSLNLYITAGEIKLKEIEHEQLPALQKKAEQTGDQMVYQELNDLKQFANRLEKRVHDLKLSRNITLQNAPQIRMIQNTNHALIEKIQSSILTAIPLWKNQITIALALFRQKKAVETQKQVSQTTNDLLLKNADMLKTNSIETAKENERGVLDVETLKQTQRDLIETLEETLYIQNEGRSKRQEAEKELIQMEDELKNKLSEMK